MKLKDIDFLSNEFDCTTTILQFVEQPEIARLLKSWTSFMIDKNDNEVVVWYKVPPTHKENDRRMKAMKAMVDRLNRCLESTHSSQTDK